MKKLLFIGLTLFVFNSEWAAAQDRPYLNINYRSNLLGQKLEIYSGEQRLNRAQVLLLMEADPDAYDLFRRATINKRWQTAMDVSAGAMLAGSLYYVISPPAQGAGPNNLFLPILIGNVVTGLASGIFKRKSRELTTQAIEVYNLGSQGNPSNNYFRNNTYTFPGMTHIIYF